jgi:hypothetical protein
MSRKGRVHDPSPSLGRQPMGPSSPDAAVTKLVKRIKSGKPLTKFNRAVLAALEMTPEEAVKRFGQ